MKKYITPIKIYSFLDYIENNIDIYLQHKELIKYKDKPYLYLYFLKKYLENNNIWKLYYFNKKENLYYLHYKYNKNFKIICQKNQFD